MKSKILLFLSVCIMSSCLGRPDDVQEFLNRQLEKHFVSVPLDYSYVVVIPRKGCNACAKKADELFEKHKKDSTCLFIFTNLISEKLLKIEIGYDNANLYNVLIDRDNYYYSSDYVDCGYPLLLKKKEDGRFVCSFLLDSNWLDNDSIE